MNICMIYGIIPFRRNKVAFERVKALGFNDRKWVHIINIDPLPICQKCQNVRLDLMTQ